MPEEKTHFSLNCKLWLGILGILIFLAGVGISSYIVGKKQIKPSICVKDKDCVLAIRIDECCNCPQAVLKEQLKKDKGLVEYEKDKDYRHYIKKDCSKISCSPCEFPEEVVCTEGQCTVRFLDKKTKVSCDELQGLEMKKLTEISKEECLKCGGEWGNMSMDISMVGCNPKTSDTGERCTDDEECIGICLAESDTATFGRCSEYKYNLGCSREFLKGQVVQVCRD